MAVELLYPTKSRFRKGTRVRIERKGLFYGREGKIAIAPSPDAFTIRVQFSENRYDAQDFERKYVVKVKL